MVMGRIPPEFGLHGIASNQAASKLHGGSLRTCKSDCLSCMDGRAWKAVSTVLMDIDLTCMPKILINSIFRAL